MTETNEKQSHPAPELREYAMGTLNVDHRHVHRHAGLLTDPEAEDMLTKAAEAYEPLTDDAPLSFWDTDFATDCLKAAGTSTATQALQNRDQETLSFISGLVGYQSDASGLRSLSKLQRLIERTPVFIGYIFGLMGSGKTDFSLLLAQIFKSVHGSSNVTVATNFDCTGQDEQITQYSRLIEELESRHDQLVDDSQDDPDEFYMIIDEAAQIFTGSGSDQQKAKHLAKLLKLARKANAHVILIGQDGKDIGPSLRALCTVFVEKHDKKNLSMYTDVKNREGINKILSLKGVPPTDIPYETYDEGRFVFDVDDDAGGEDAEELRAELEELEVQHERKMMAVLCETDNGMSQRDVADVYDTSPKSVRRARDKYSNELQSLGIEF
ncbi:zonular occludens toxin domain-containing protein [Halobium palmae]|uniref:Zonular occludens toxin domain-containing protein n=1 Tax=Halobium palmae TaxID=1776492 RepID=A0ABD5RV04_9EURY